jgi:hypothetical protein
LREALRITGQLLSLTTEFRAQVGTPDAEGAALEAKVAALDTDRLSGHPVRAVPGVERFTAVGVPSRRPGRGV